MSNAKQITALRKALDDAYMNRSVAAEMHDTAAQAHDHDVTATAYQAHVAADNVWVATKKALDDAITD